jgi:hypothetical protein
VSIIIHNIGGDPLGESEYELLINNRLLTKFKHNRTKGLAECLREAAKAMDRAQWQWQMVKDFTESQQDTPPDIAQVIEDHIWDFS